MDMDIYIYMDMDMQTYYREVYVINGNIVSFFFKNLKKSSLGGLFAQVFGCAHILLCISLVLEVM